MEQAVVAGRHEADATVEPARRSARWPGPRDGLGHQHQLLNMSDEDQQELGLSQVASIERPTDSSWVRVWKK